MWGIVILILAGIGLLVILPSAVNLLLGLIVPVLIWALVGWLTGYLMRGRGYGALYNVLLGVGGGVLGSLIFRLFNLQGIGDLWLIGNVIVGVAGALVLIYGVRLFSSNKAFGKYGLPPPSPAQAQSSAGRGALRWCAAAWKWRRV